MLITLIILTACWLSYKIIFSGSKPRSVCKSTYENYVVGPDGVIDMVKKIDIVV